LNGQNDSGKRFGFQYKYGPYMGEEAKMGLFSSGFNSLFHFKGSISVISDNNI
jgi:hypothetical protein